MGIREGVSYGAEMSTEGTVPNICEPLVYRQPSSGLADVISLPVGHQVPEQGLS